MTLPAPGVPFQSGQVISSAQVNATLTDLATEVGSSLDRAGRGGALAPIRGVDGTAAAPSISFTAEPASGIYRAGPTDVRLTVGGVDALKLVPGGVAELDLPAAAFGLVKATGTGAQLQLQGNRNATDATPDVAIAATAARTAGTILTIYNGPQSGYVPLLAVDYLGLVRLLAPAAAIQPAGYVVPVTPNAGWNPSGQIGYWKTADGAVCLRGATAFVSGTNPVFTLPAGFRPAISRTFLSTFAVGGPFTIVTITATGNVTSVNQSTGANTSTSFDGISFLAEQ